VAGTVIGFDPASFGGLGFLWAHTTTGATTILWLDGNPIIFAPHAVERMRVDIAGNVGIGTASPASRLHVNGDIRFTGNLIGGGKGGYVMDQFVNGLGEALEQGDVVVVGAAQPSLSYGPNNNIPIPEVEVAQHDYDTRVCGIVSEVYGELRSEADHAATPGTRVTRGNAPHTFTPEELEQRDRTQVGAGQIGWMVTLGAFAHCKVDADVAPITAGDLLTTSSTRGHAQKVLDPGKAVGAIIGKALGSLHKGNGKIPVLVLLQ
jgi:hypothetical protein